MEITRRKKPWHARSKFTTSQIYKILVEAKLRGIAPTARWFGFSQQTIRRWREKYGGSDRKTVERLKNLEEDNALGR